MKTPTRKELYDMAKDDPGKLCKYALYWMVGVAGGNPPPLGLQAHAVLAMAEVPESFKDQAIRSALLTLELCKEPILQEASLVVLNSWGFPFTQPDRDFLEKLLKEDRSPIVLEFIMGMLEV